MKKLILLIAFLAISVTTFAQQDKSYIEATGVTKYKRTVEKYIAKTIISKDLDYNNNCETIAELKSNYFKKLMTANFDTSKLKEDKMGYLTFGYKKEGMLLVLETSSKEEFMNFIIVNATGTQVYTRDAVYKLSSQEVADLAKAAIENARQKAEKTAGSTGKKIGNILMITDHIQNETKEVLYYDNLGDKGLYQVIVRFELL